MSEYSSNDHAELASISEPSPSSMAPLDALLSDEDEDIVEPSDPASPAILQTDDLFASFLATESGPEDAVAAPMDEAQGNANSVLPQTCDADDEAELLRAAKKPKLASSGTTDADAPAPVRPISTPLRNMLVEAPVATAVAPVEEDESSDLDFDSLFYHQAGLVGASQLLSGIMGVKPLKCV
jgi:hypothetical protein